MLVAALIFSAFGGLVMFAARTSPDEATLNIAKWVTWMGLPVPEWLSNKSADNWGKRLGIVLLIAGGIFLCAWVYGRAQAPSSPPAIYQGPGSAYSQGQQGGATIGTLNIGQLPRHIPPDASAALSSALTKTNPSGTVEVQTDMMGCPDCDGFARDFEHVLGAASHLKVIPLRNGITALPFQGVILGIRDPNNPPAVVKEIQATFSAVGAPLTIREYPPNEPSSDAIFLIASPIAR